MAYDINNHWSIWVPMGSSCEDPERGTFPIPRDLLPKGVKEGDVLNITIAIDREATEKRKKKIQGMVDDLKKSDQGGDIQL